MVEKWWLGPNPENDAWGRLHARYIDDDGHVTIGRSTPGQQQRERMQRKGLHPDQYETIDERSATEKRHDDFYAIIRETEVADFRKLLEGAIPSDIIGSD